MEGMSAVTHRVTKQHICLEISPMLTINLLTTQTSKTYKKIDERDFRIEYVNITKPKHV